MRDSKLVIVRRGHFATYEVLTRAFADDPSVEIIWDRRIDERRRSVDRIEGGERRRVPPAQWSQMHYMIAADGHDLGH